MSDPIHLQQVSKSSVAAIDPRLGSNAAAVVLDDFIVAVDAGMRPFAARLFRAALEETYHRPLKYLCVTHYHHDHTFSLKPFKDITLFASSQIVDNLKQSPDWTPEAFVRWKQDDANGGEWLDDVELIIPPVLFHQRMDIIDNEKTVEFHHSGGHTSCSVYGYYPDEQVLFAADLLFAGRFPFAGDRTNDPERWISILRNWLNMDIAQVIPGHGPVADLTEVRKQLDFMEILKRNTLEAIKAGKTFPEVVLPDVYPVGDKEKWFAEMTQKRWYEFYFNFR